jgi:nitroreductase
MELDRVIRRRRMTRRFDPDPIDREDVVALLDLARRAPSAGYTQGFSFLVVDEPGHFWDLTGARGWFAEHDPGLLSAPLLVLPLADQEAYTVRYAEADKAGHGLEQAARWPVPYWFIDCAMATQNLLLLAEDRGLGALFFGIFGDERALLRHLGVPERVRAIGAVALGRRSAADRPSGSPLTRERLPLDAVVHWGRWGARTTGG